MWHWRLLFLSCALLAAVFGFTDTWPSAQRLARDLFFGFAILFVLSLLAQPDSRRLRRLHLAALLMPIVLGLAVFAQDREPSAPSGRVVPGPSQGFDDYDLNRDGSLTMIEIQGDAVLAGRFRDVDRNLDRQLSRTEFSAGRVDRNRAPGRNALAPTDPAPAR